MATWPNGESEAAALLRRKDWGATTLGPIDSWSPRLKAFVDLVLDSREPLFVAAGADLAMIYNDAVRPFLAAMHPRAFGAPFREVFEAIADQIEPRLQRVLSGVQDVMVDQRFALPWRRSAPEGWFTATWTPIRGEHGDTVGFLGSLRETTDAHLTTSKLSAAEDRLSFLLRLSDVLRPLADPAEAQAAAAKLLGEHLRVDRCAYGEVDDATQYVTVHRDYHAPHIGSVAGRYRLEDYGTETAETIRQGDIFVLNDVLTSPYLTKGDIRRDYAAMGVRAAVVAPLIKSGRLVVLLTLQQAVPRNWTAHEIKLIEDVADRTLAAVERTRAEAALRESQVRFAEFARASSAGLWIRDAATLRLEYVSPAMSEIYGVEPDALAVELEGWAAIIVPDDREAALDQIHRARSGVSAAEEFRIQRPLDQAFRWIRDTSFPLSSDGRIGRIGGITEDVTDARLAVEHQAVLLAELQHRVRNIMAITRSIAHRSADSAADVADYQSALEGRLLALARVQTLLTREANAGGWIRDVIETEVGAQVGRRDQYDLRGPNISLSPKAVEVLSLAFHELATNASKYGAFSVPEGRLRVSWATYEKHGRTWLGIDWVEEGAPQRIPGTRRGFGSELIEGRIPYELGGTGKITVGPGGARCRLEFPLQDGESILETDAPTPGAVLGGNLDMTDAPSLAGRRVLVVEDDYYLASDTAAALRGAGAEVLGPCPSEETALELLANDAPTHAVVDLNLGGGGPRFDIARKLQARGVRLLLLTGYDPDVIPVELEQVARLQKPVPFGDVVDALSEL